MKPAPFKYLAVDSEEALIAALSEHGDDARLLAGGQSLVPMMNFRLVSPAVLIDFNGTGDLSYIDCDGRTLRIGALTRHAMLEDSDLVSRECPLLATAIRYVAHRAVRNRGTAGGSLALAYPGAELPLVFMTLNASINLNSRRGERLLPVNEFIHGALDTALADDEFIRGVDIVLPPEQSATSFIETSRRHGDFALAAAAVVAACDAQHRLTYLRIGISGGTGAPIRLLELEQALMGETALTAPLREVVGKAIAEVEVFGDHHYPEDYRRHLLRAVLHRSLLEATSKAEARHVQ